MFSFLFCCFLGYFVYWLAYGRFRRSDGLNGPTVQPFLGNYGDFKRHGLQLHLMLDEYYKTNYGKIFSFFHQNREMKVVSDGKLINEILVKKFENFSKREFFLDLPWPCKHMITLNEGAKWKYIRSLLTAVTKPNKLKEFAGHLVKAASTYMSKLEQTSENGKILEVYSHSKGYVMEILLSITFSFDHPNQSEFNQTVVKLVEKFMNPPSWVYDVGALPFGDRLIKNMPSAYKKNLQPLIDTALSIVAGRKNETEKKEDLLQILLDIQKNTSPEDKDQLTNEDILGAGLILLTAVHNLTSVTLTTCIYYIAKYPEVQRKIQKEIDDCSSAEGFPSWEHLTTDLPYLNNVIKESKRLHPPSFAMFRECSQSCTIDGTIFEKGDRVLIPTFSIHRDEKHWKNATSFNPDRFNGEKSSSPLYSHGAGPRMCLGKLLSNLEVKLVLILMLKKYNISLCTNKNSADMLQCLSYKTNVTVQATSTFDEPLYLKIEKRAL